MTMLKTSVVMLGLSLLLCVGCSKEKPQEVPECCADDPAGIETSLSKDSVYQLDSVWTDQDGKQRRLREFKGKPQVVAMVFTHCQYACPMTLALLKKIDSEVSKTPVHYLLLSMDPERDTPEVLKAYAQKEGLDPHRWTLLRGDADAVREIAAVLGVRYKQNPDGGFAHSNLITLLDRHGAIRHRLKGLGAEPGPLIAAIRKHSP
jgi:protein SCO1